ncbi:MAG: DMT family transporter [Burkholderiales bacterium]|nr:DMT family transporter [Burkholderiales bacterium]
MNAPLNTSPSSLRGILWIVLGMSLFTLANALFKHLGADLPMTTVMALRAATILLLLAPFALRQRGRAIRSQRPGLHLGRAAFTSLSAACAVYALSRLSLGDVTAYALTTAIWLIPLGLIFLGERVYPQRWVGVAVGFGGVLVIAHPTLSGPLLAIGLALLGAASDGVLGVLLKRGANSESALAILWWTYLGQFLVFGTMSGFTVPHLALAQILPTLLLGGVSIACMLCFVQGYRHADASLAEIGCFSGLIVGPALGWLMFRETPAPGYWLGSTLLAGGIAIALIEFDWRRVLRPSRLPTPVGCEAD